MSKFTRGICTSRSWTEDKLFGLRHGQMRKKRIVHDGGWFDEFGKRLGCGDLSAEDFEMVRRELKGNEMFVVLIEGDSFWNFRLRRKPALWKSSTEVDEEAPGVDYVAKKCLFIIARAGFYCVYDHIRSRDDAREIHGLQFRVISRKDAKKLFPRRRLWDIATDYLRRFS